MSKKISRRQFIKGIGVAGMGVASAQLLIACAAPAPAPGAAPDAAGSEAAPAATDIVLRVQVAPGGQATMPVAMSERYQDETGITVEIEEVIYGEIETKTQTGYISNTNPDLLYGHHRWLFINFLRGIYMELDDLFAADPLPDLEDIYPSVLAGNTLDGKNFSIPGVVHPGGNIAVNFNKTMLEEKGIPLPQAGWTFEDWEAIARAGADPDNGIFGIGFEGMNSFHYYSNTSRSFGSPDARAGWVMNDDGTELLYDQPLHGEVVAQGLGLGVGQHTADLGFEFVVVGQPPRVGRLRKFVVGQRRPQEHGQPGGQRVRPQRIHAGLGGFGLGQKQEVGRDQHGLQGQPQRGGIAVAPQLGLIEQGQIAVDFPRFQRPAKRLASDRR